MSEQTDLEGWLVERSIYGWLGKMPEELVDAPPDLIKRWKTLSKGAKAVAEKRFSPRKVDEAKAIERERAAIIQEAKDRKR